MPRSADPHMFSRPPPHAKLSLPAKNLHKCTKSAPRHHAGHTPYPMPVKSTIRSSGFPIQFRVPYISHTQDIFPYGIAAFPYKPAALIFTKSTGRPRSHISGFNVIFGSPYGLAAPTRRRRFPCLVAFPHTFSRFPHVILRPPTQAASPYGIVVPPYNHAPDASPHTFWQIPTGRPSPHTSH